MRSDMLHKAGSGNSVPAHVISSYTAEHASSGSQQFEKAMLITLNSTHWIANGGMAGRGEDPSGWHWTAVSLQCFIDTTARPAIATTRRGGLGNDDEQLRSSSRQESLP